MSFRIGDHVRVTVKGIVTADGDISLASGDTIAMNKATKVELLNSMSLSEMKEEINDYSFEKR